MKVNLTIRILFYTIFTLFMVGFVIIHECGIVMDNIPLRISGLTGSIISASVLSWMLAVSPQFSIVNFQ